MATPLLTLTDGTVRVDLLRPPFHVRDVFRQARPLWKGGGAWRDSPLADGRSLASRRLTNITFEIPFVLNRGCDDSLWAEWAALLALLEKGVSYWTTWQQDEPVWLERRSGRETGIAYAIIKGFAIPDVDDPVHLSQTFRQRNISSSLYLELGIWQSEPPGEGHAIEISSRYTDLDSNTQGRAATTLPEVYVGNKHVMASLTDIYNWTSPGGPFSANLLGAALPFDIFPGGAAGPGNGDIMYFGIDTVTYADAGPFDSLVFDILTAATYGAGDFVTWEYWNGAWVNLTSLDWTAHPNGILDVSGPDTQPFVATGTGTVVWSPPSDWATVAVNGVTGYWVRAVVTEAAGITRAQQQNRDIYTIVNPFFEVDEAQIDGDYPALAQYMMRPRSDYLSSLEGYFNRIILGGRKMSRGAAFDAYLNLSDVQQPTGHTATLNGAGSCAWQSDPRAPTGRCIRYNPGGASAWSGEFDHSLSNALGPDYAGLFHGFLRYNRGAGGVSSDIQARFYTALGTGGYTFYDSGIIDVPSVATFAGLLAFGLLDLGVFRLPPGASVPQAGLTTTYLRIDLKSTGAYTADFYDFILMPADECFIDTRDPVTYFTGCQFGLTLGSLTVPRSTVELDQTLAWDSSSGAFYSPERWWRRWRVDAAVPLVLQTVADQRIWVLSHNLNTAAFTDIHAPPHLALEVNAEAADRYDVARGSR